ncbi:aldo/keto reductase [Mesorhizobium sp. B2-4-17]|uniref:aldo/keto reductase n=1 Tax=Mesorhizobium sp. B2-4-17 TaxID=2589932 RepID=UPI001FEF894C|nr:aldo/keto reductase [Mesorhizobium sp. B2-4-17]
MAVQPNAASAGTFRIGGEIEINRLGFGSMRLTGRGIWGEPADRAECLRTLGTLRRLGVNFVDTANSYGPDVSEKLIREALHPYDGMLIATKAGFTREGPDAWTPKGNPDHLIAEAKRSAQKLGVEQIGLWQLHRIDPKVPQDEQFGAIRQMLDSGLVRHAGLSEVTVPQIEAARRVFGVATVQNRYNLTDRGSQDVLDYCDTNGIGFIPWFPLASGRLTGSGSRLDKIAKAHDASPGQIALAWLLRTSPMMLPIPGTSKVWHAEENIAAAEITLTDDEFETLETLGHDKR